MSCTMARTDHAAIMSSQPFFPSAAQAAGETARNYWFAEAVVNMQMRVGMATFVPSAAIALPTHPVVEKVMVRPAEPASDMASSKEMAENLVEKLGFPITGLASVLDVERKTVYDWLKGAEAGAATADRLRVLNRVFGREAEGSVRFFHRFWRRELEDGSSLQEILLSPCLDVARAASALDELRPAVLASMASDKARKAVSFADARPSDLLSDFLEAGVRG